MNEEDAMFEELTALAMDNKPMPEPDSRLGQFIATLTPDQQDVLRGYFEPLDLNFPN